MSAPRLTLLVLAPALLASCNAVRAVKSPADDVHFTAAHARAPLPDDCPVAVVDGHCRLEDDPTGEATFQVVCDTAPPRERVVGHASVCMWGHGELAELNRLACRAGGDTVVLEYAVTDSCIEESLDGVSGTSLGEYVVYRLR